MKVFIYGFLFFHLFFLTLHGKEDVIDNSTGAAFPGTVTFSQDDKNYDLEVTGVATRKKFMVKVYSIAHYMQKAAHLNSQNILQEVMSDAYAKQFTIKWARSVGVDKIREAYEESFHRVFSKQEFVALSSEINTFIHFFTRDAQKGDEYLLRWTPGGHIEVLINGLSVGTLMNTEFAKGLWSIWAGEKSIVNRESLFFK